jgi:hypothetical protein
VGAGGGRTSTSAAMNAGPIILGNQIEEIPEFAIFSGGF